MVVLKFTTQDALRANEAIFTTAPAQKRGSSLLVVLGLLFVIFIFGFGYANYLNGQVYFLQREKDYEAARLIIKSAFTETLYLINYDNAEFIARLKTINQQSFMKPFDFYEAKVEAAKRLMKKVFENYDNPSLRVWYELVEIVDFKQNPAPGEKFARFVLHGQLKAGIIMASQEYELLARLAQVNYDNRDGTPYLKLSPERVFAVISKEEHIETGRYYGICVYTGTDAKKAKKLADSNDEFKALLVLPNGAPITDRSLQSGNFCLTFGPPVIK